MPVRAIARSVQVPLRSDREIPGTEKKRRRRQWGRIQETRRWCAHGTEHFRVWETEARAEKLEAPQNYPRVTTNRGAGSVSWRGQRWRPNELGFGRMTCSSYGRDWRRSLNQEQNMGQAGADLCTAALGTSTSVDQLRYSLKEPTHRVSGLGALFVG